MNTEALDIDRSKPVLVTGATGYIAGWVIKRLLEEGLTVHGTVRDASKEDRLAYLYDQAKGTEGTLKLFSAYLTKAGSFAEGMQGCGVVFHVASPYQLEVKDPQKELVEPAVDGTRNVLEQANATPSVTRVVVTSSCAAIFGDNADLAKTPSGKFTEEVWNESSTIDHQPYSYSKTMAEKEAWRIADAQDRWRLVVMNPPGVFGPGVKVHGSSESFRIITQLGDGTMASGAPDFRIGMVDVRDLAEAHLRGGFLPNAEGRYIVSGGDSSFPAVAAILRDRFPGYPLPKRTAPKFLIWLLGPMVNAALTRKVVSRNIGLPWHADNSKSVRELGMSYRPLSETMSDHFQQLIDEGVLGSKRAA